VSDLTELADERFVSLCTFRRDGTPVSTPVWIVRDGERLLVTTVDGTGKVKRIARRPGVELRPCTRRGAVTEDAPVRHGRVSEVIREPGAVERLSRRFRAKYGVEYRLFMLIERVAARGPRRRCMLVISEPA
jgi:PPOX class probable F420-dependent enzyme